MSRACKFVFCGNDLTSAIPVVLPEDAASRANQILACDMDYITGANGHANAAGAVFTHATPTRMPSELDTPSFWTLPRP